MDTTWLWCVIVGLFGLSVGSFLNVVIWRLPRNGSLVEPQWSYCPNCNHRLMTADLIPLFSYLARGRRCKYCSKPISSRYFWVELATAVLFVVLYFHFRNETPNAIAMVLFGAVLVPIFCTDLELFEIPPQLNLIAFVIALSRDLFGIVTHEHGHELVWGFLPVSIVGAVVGVLVFGFVRVIGWLWKRQEAMGLGDVLLARAMGAMLASVVPAGFSPLRLVPIWVLFSCGSGAVIGVALLQYRNRHAGAEDTSGDDESGEEVEDESSFAQELGDIGYVLWMQDAWEYIAHLFSRKQTQTPVMEEDEWTPAPTAIPFGPFMIIGFIITLLAGEHITAIYLAFALPKAAASGAIIPW